MDPLQLEAVKLVAFVAVIYVALWLLTSLAAKTWFIAKHVILVALSILAYTRAPQLQQYVDSFCAASEPSAAACRFLWSIASGAKPGGA
jgi:hypothetical protein